MTTCPGFAELQSERVQKNFDINKLPGTYYELAFHDYTQYPTCPQPTCIRSVKSFVPDLGKSQIKDMFTLGCYGAPYTWPLFFNTTEDNGSFNGFLKSVPWWKILEPGEEYPDTVV